MKKLWLPALEFDAAITAETICKPYSAGKPKVGVLHGSARNTYREIADALRLAVAAETERSGITVLTGLNGVDVPVASAILAAVIPRIARYFH